MNGTRGDAYTGRNAETEPVRRVAATLRRQIRQRSFALRLRLHMAVPYVIDQSCMAEKAKISRGERKGNEEGRRPWSLGLF